MLEFRALTGLASTLENHGECKSFFEADMEGGSSGLEGSQLIRRLKEGAPSPVLETLLLQLHLVLESQSVVVGDCRLHSLDDLKSIGISIPSTLDRHYLHYVLHIFFQATFNDEFSRLRVELVSDLVHHFKRTVSLKRKTRLTSFQSGYLVRHPGFQVEARKLWQLLNESRTLGRSRITQATVRRVVRALASERPKRRRNRWKPIDMSIPDPTPIPTSLITSPLPVDLLGASSSPSSPATLSHSHSLSSSPEPPPETSPTPCPHPCFSIIPSPPPTPLQASPSNSSATTLFFSVSNQATSLNVPVITTNETQHWIRDSDVWLLHHQHLIEWENLHGAFLLSIPSPPLPQQEQHRRRRCNRAGSLVDLMHLQGLLDATAVTSRIVSEPSRSLPVQQIDLPTFCLEWIDNPPYRKKVTQPFYVNRGRNILPDGSKGQVLLYSWEDLVPFLQAESLWRDELEDYETLLDSLLEELAPFLQRCDFSTPGGVWPEPRDTANFGDVVYTYAGVLGRKVHNALPPLLRLCCHALSQCCNVEYNNVLVNVYRNRRDHIRWHADNEAILGTNPTVLSFSLGTERTFELRPLERSHRLFMIRVPLVWGRTVVMSGSTQEHFQHRVPQLPHKAQSGIRLNLTLRQVLFTPPTPAPSKRSSVTTRHLSIESEIEPPKHVLGTLPGISEGHVFLLRDDLYLSGVHRCRQGAICATANGGVHSLLLAGCAYDSDNGSSFEFLAPGGRHRGNGRLLCNQHELLSVVNGHLQGLRGLIAMLRLYFLYNNRPPTRVLRAGKTSSRRWQTFISVHAPDSGWRYDGLYCMTGLSYRQAPGSEFSGFFFAFKKASTTRLSPVESITAINATEVVLAGLRALGLHYDSLS